MSLFNELKRRNVLRVAIAYIVVAWLAMQVADVLLNNIPSPDWIFPVLLLVLALGLPIAVFLAWAFELTPEGIKREHEVDRSQSITPHTGRKLNLVITGLLAVAVVYFVVDKWFIVDHAQPSAPALAALEKSIAVLPFRNRSDSAEDIHFVDGIHDDILTQLSKLSGLDKVISRTSTEAYRDTAKPILQIGQELGVATILEGGVQRAGNRVRINMQLIDAATDKHLWAETYDRELTVENLFVIQSEITREIVGALQAVLSDQDNQRLQSMPTTSLEAYEQFVLGRQQLADRTAEAVRQAQAHFEKAIELDPDYALAYVGLADAWALQPEYAGARLEDTLAPRRAAIDKALALDPMLGEAYASLGLLSSHEGRPEDAEASYLKAIELSPNYATAYHWYALRFRDTGRLEEAVLQARKALELDPAAPVLTVVLSGILDLLGRVEEARAALLDGVKRNPGFPGMYLGIAQQDMKLGRVGEAVRWIHAAARVAPSNPKPRFGECTYYLELGDDRAAEKCIDALATDFPQASKDVFADLRAELYWYRLQAPAAVALYREFAQDDSDTGARYGLALAHIVNGEPGKARPILQSLEPEYFGDEAIDVSANNFWSSIFSAVTMYEGGQRDRANDIFDEALAAMKGLHRTRGVGYGIWDVIIHVTRGDKQEAVQALRDARESGWRSGWWYVRTPFYDGMRTEPEWNALVSEFEADIAGQRQWYEAHRDDPLF